jgi:valyl-tRNA synthetase
MDKTYDPHAIERRWYQIWEENGYFAPAQTDCRGDPYCIMIPPPNVTGSLHMGHAFQDTVMDILIRYHRMRGDTTLWQAGTDHAGIATQMVVERQLNAEGKTRHAIGREAFIARVWEWKEQSGDTITRQLRRMGASLDWSRARFTMDEGLSRAVREVFVRLHEEGLIYRGQRLVNWDPVLRTAVSDLEVNSEEESGHLWHIRYPLSEGDGYLVVATTRPETLLGDTAVAVHPADERYGHLIGRNVRLPLAGREIPIIADEYVDPAFGSGCVKITPAHDFNDYAVGQRHQLASINVMNVDASIREYAEVISAPGAASMVSHDPDNAPAGRQGDPHAGARPRAFFQDRLRLPGRYAGLDRFEARDLIVHDLSEQGLLERADEHRLTVPRGDRSGVVLEPFLTDQWFVSVQPLADAAIRAVEDGRVRFIPENWDRTYYEWMCNLQDWCISRQIWWGHRIPAWYDAAGNVYVARSEAEARQKYGLPAELPLRQDDDVLDTWFSSALWPFSTLGWPEETPELKTFYPTSVLVTGFDIIFFWVARMLMMGLKFMGDVPFREIYIHGLVRDAEGQKMSKSKGNVLDPLDLIDGIGLDELVAKRTSGLMQPHMAARIEKRTRQEFPKGIPSYGTDALRFTFASLASTGRDIRFDLARVEGYRNFCNKLWNAARYVLMNTEGQDTGLTDAPCRLSLPDRWIMSRLQQTVQAVTDAIESYRFDLAAHAIYEFVWNGYCDWYLELSKIILQTGDEAEQRGTRRTLVGVLETGLRLLHPLIPFISEEIWQRVAPLAGKPGKTIMLQPYPQPVAEAIDPAALIEMDWLMTFVLGIRRIRGEMNIPPGRPLAVLLQDGSQQDRLWLGRNQPLLRSLGRIERIEWLDEAAVAPESAIALVGSLKLLVPMSGLIDKAAETLRLEKEIQKLSKERARVENKLNDEFIRKAPAEIVLKERNRLAELRSTLAQLQEQASKIRSL